VERDWGPELSQHPVKTAIGENLLSEADKDKKGELDFQELRSDRLIKYARPQALGK